MPLVSVVLIFLNEERFLEEAVKSVRDQKLADWELILVDDGSTDRSTMIACNLAAEDKRVRYVDHPGHANRGASASRNLGAAHATAPYIAFLDADDVWEPEKLAEQVDLLESMPDVAMVSGAVRYWYSWDPAATEQDYIVIKSDRRLDPPEAALKLYPLGKDPGAGVDLLVRRRVFEAVGGFEEHFRGIYQLYEDQVFLIKVYLRYPVYLSSRVWRHYRQHDASCVARTTGRDYWRVRGFFLDWLQADVRRLGDPRVTGALRRAGREIRYQPLNAHALQAVDRLLAPLPPKYKDLVKRNLRRVKRKIAAAKRGMAEPDPPAGARPS